MPDPAADRELLRSALGRTPECPGIEALAAGSGDPAMQQHTVSCARCRAEIELLHRFEEAAPATQEEEPLQWLQAELARRAPAILNPAPALQRMPPAPLRAARWGAGPILAAALVLVIGIAIYQRPGETPRPSGSNRQPVWRSSQFAALSPAGDLTSAPAEFRWQPVDGAASYRVRLLEVDGTPVWEAAVAGPAAAIPPELGKIVIPGRAFQWDVTAFDPSGRKIAATDLQHFHILATRP